MHYWLRDWAVGHIMTLLHGNLFRITCLLWVEFTGKWWFPLTMGQIFDASLDDSLNNLLNKHTRGRWITMLWLSLGILSMRWLCRFHYNDVIMSAMASQITSLTIVYSTFYSGADKRKHQSSASLARKGQWRGKCFHLMTSSCCVRYT